jgi:hypothetical protein
LERSEKAIKLNDFELIKLNLHMSILVKTQNENEEKVLLAFLNSLKYQYEIDIDNLENAKRYNYDIEIADKEIEDGNFQMHDEVELILKNRTKNPNEY